MGSKREVRLAGRQESRGRMPKRLFEEAGDHVQHNGEDRSKLSMDQRTRSLSWNGIRIAGVGKESVIWSIASDAIPDDHSKTAMEWIVEAC